jgi:hypothetical protein
MPSIGKAAASCLCALIILLLYTPVSADPIYRYVEKNGTTNYTDQWDSIPERYRNQAQALDPETLKPLTAGSSLTSRPRMTSSNAAPSPLTSPSALAQPGHAWLDDISRWNVSLPSDYQLGVGSTALILIAGAIFLMRMSGNPVVKLGLKLVVTLALGGSVYLMYFSGLNERIADLTGRSPSQRLSGQKLLGDVAVKTKRVTDTLKHATVDQVKTVINKTTDVTVGEARRTVQQANQANAQLQKNLEEIAQPPETIGIDTSSATRDVAQSAQASGPSSP